MIGAVEASTAAFVAERVEMVVSETGVPEGASIVLPFLPFGSYLPFGSFLPLDSLALVALEVSFSVSSCTEGSYTTIWKGTLAFKVACKAFSETGM